MQLGRMLKPGDFMGLIGDLGAGKTTFVQGVAAGWGALDQVSSPTFVLVNVYRHANGQHMYHMDAYRLQDALEAEMLDIETLLASGPLVVEWAGRISDALPEDGLWVQLQYVDDTQRLMQITAQGKRFETILNSLKKRVFAV